MLKLKKEEQNKKVDGTFLIPDEDTVQIMRPGDEFPGKIGSVDVTVQGDKGTLTVYPHQSDLLPINLRYDPIN